MTKRRKFPWAAFAACALLFSVPSWGQVIKLTLADQNPANSWGAINAMDPWVKKVEQATKGRVKIEVHYGQTLAKGPDIWNAVKSGVVDIGWCFHGYWPDMTPLADVVTLPFLPLTSAEKASEVLWKLYEKFPSIQQHFRDVKPLMLWTSDPYFLITSKKQVKTLEDLKGMKIRVPGGPPTSQMKALGAVPVLIPMTENYSALDKGVIDGMGAPWMPIAAYRLVEVVKYYTMVPLFTTYFSMSFNKQKWDSLPKDVQQAILSVSGVEGSKFWGRNFFDTAEKSVWDAAKKGNYPVNQYSPPPSELARWRKVAGEPMWDEWVKSMEAKGRTDARQILNTTLQLLK